MLDLENQLKTNLRPMRHWKFEKAEKFYKNLHSLKE